MAIGLELPLELERRGQRDLLLISARHADGAGVLAAMARIQHHERRRRPRFRLAWGRSRCWPVAGRPGRRHCHGVVQPGRQQEGADNARTGAKAAQKKAARDR